MIVIQETTEWDHPGMVNHIYFLSDNKRYMLAYIRGDTGESKIFTKPIEISLKGRTFEVLRKVDDSNPGIAVPGSKGNMYYVTKSEGKYSCTCTGFTYHGTCKHIKQVEEQHGH